MCYLIMIGQVLGFLFLCTLSYIDVCFWTSEAGWPKLLLIGRSMLAMADTMMSFSLELVSLYFTEHFSLGSNQDAFITWRLNNLESILSFFFPSSALRYFLRQDMWGKIFDRKCVINFPCDITVWVLVNMASWVSSLKISTSQKMICGIIKMIGAFSSILLTDLHTIFGGS